MGDREIGGAETVAVASLGEDVKFGGDFEFFEGAEVDEDVFYVDGIVFGLQEEGGWSGGGWIDAVGEGVEGGGVGEVGGVDEDGEVGFGVGLVDGFGGTLEVLDVIA